MKNEICKMEHCEDDVRYPILGVCGACYSGIAYWRGRSQGDKKARLGKIKRLNGRMEYMIDKPKDTPKNTPRKRGA